MIRTAQLILAVSESAALHVGNDLQSACLQQADVMTISSGCPAGHGPLGP